MFYFRWHQLCLGGWRGTKPCKGIALILSESTKDRI